MTSMALGLALLLAAPQGNGSAAGFLDAVRVGAPITRGNLTVFPLALRRPAAAEDHLMLDEAIARKQLVIEEAGTSGSVNALEVLNRSDHPVVLVGGELLLGGKQDRIVARSVVLRPRSRTEVPVFCVEHGRWSGGKSFELAGAMGHTELRKVALGGDQGKVWGEVARENGIVGAVTASGTYRAAARKLDADVGPLAREIAAELARDPQAAGIAVAIDGDVVAVEWFASPRLFARIRQKLVASYAAQSRASGSAGPKPAPAAPPPAAVVDFAAKAERGDALVERVRDAPGEAAVQTTYLRR
jgi:ARG/rhodanese/phosphatase superfamily protein